MPYRLAVLLLLLSPLLARAQATDWQQRVQYAMDVTLHPDRHGLEGTQRLVYTNNSPDTLRQAFYHLYFNAFQPGSMMAERNRQLPDPDGRVVPRIFELGPDEIGQYTIQSATQDGTPVAYRITDTILQLDLPHPIPPGGATTFELAWTAQIPLQTRRSGRDNREGIAYSMSQWYPKLAQYDATGWHADPYVGREFYAPFGTFDVRLRLPARFVVGASGVLQNPDAVGHGYQTDTTRAVVHAPGDTLTWHFRAEDVHDFAWAADPDYIHDRFEDELGIVYHLLYQEDVAERWQAFRETAPALLTDLSLQLGLYPYPQFTIAQAGDGGMEYPMIIFITGRRSPGSLLGVTAHEAAHEWFYAALGTNEADVAWMDEGLTNYAATEAVAAVRGRPASHLNVLATIAVRQMMGLAEPMNTPSDWFTTNAAYGTAAYAGGHALIETLGYVISDSLRDVTLRQFAERYRFRHPQPEDLEVVAESVSGLALDWYFAQTTGTTHPIDLAVGDLRSRPGCASGAPDCWTTTVTLRRRTPFVLPTDVAFMLEDGTVQWATVPLGIMRGAKPVPPGWHVADPWLWTAPTYTLTLETPARAVSAALDPLMQTADVNRLNNRTGLPRTVRFLQPAQPSWSGYGIGWRPLAQYADAFGPGVGLRAEGSYLLGRHTVEAMLKVWPQVLFSGGDEPELNLRDPDISAFDGVDYRLRYATDLPYVDPLGRLSVTARKHLGILEHRAQFEMPLHGYNAPVRHLLSAGLTHQLSRTDRAYELDTFPWFLEENMLTASLGYAATSSSAGIWLELDVGSSFRNLLDCRGPGGEPAACSFEFRQSSTRLALTARTAAERWGTTGRAGLLVGLGADNLALHKRFRLGAPSAEALWQHDATRALTAAFDQPLQDAHLTAFGPPGPIAYVLAADVPNLSPRPIGGTPSGTRILAGSLSVERGVTDATAWLRPLRLAAFSGIGTVWGRSTFSDPSDPDGTSGFDADNLVADAGLGVRYDVGSVTGLRRWTAQSSVLSDLHVAARFPLWVSDPGLVGETDEVAFRWLVGLTLSR